MHRRAKRACKHQRRGLKILYEDRDILVVDKPAGLLTMATDKEKDRTAYHALTDYVRKGNPKVRKQVFIVHRLDREVSGVLLFAKSYQVKVYLQGHWEETDKRYLAVVHGTMAEPAGTFSSYLIEGKSREVHATQDKRRGKLSRTEYKVLRETRNFSLLEIHLLTGRKHQIRVHMADNGHPVVGDRKYGKPDKAHKRLALHAKSIAFRHPFTGAPITVEAETPAYLERLVKGPYGTDDRGASADRHVD